MTLPYMRLPKLRPIPRNAKCPCGSGKKYKHCHMQLNRQLREMILRKDVK